MKSNIKSVLLYATNSKIPADVLETKVYFSEFFERMTLFALTVYVPLSHEHAVRDAIACSKGGAIGNYDSCSFTTIGVGRFRALEGANPHLGCIGSVEEVEEAKIETTVLQENLSSVIQAVKSAHPYEEPAIHIVQVIDYKEIISNNTMEPTICPISVVLEGLDGVGKSTVAVKLAEIMNARHMSTPPTIMHSAREWFVQQDNHMRKAYYMVCINLLVFTVLYLYYYCTIPVYYCTVYT